MALSIVHVKLKHEETRWSQSHRKMRLSGQMAVITNLVAEVVANVVAVEVEGVEVAADEAEGKSKEYLQARFD